jgi:hypothetical protein
MIKMNYEYFNLYTQLLEQGGKWLLLATGGYDLCQQAMDILSSQTNG